MTVIKILEESSKLPIELEEIKLFLKVDYEDEDNIIIRSFKTAIKQCELLIGQSLIEKKYKYSFYNEIKNDLQLLYGSVKSIESVKFINKNNEETIISPNTYFLDEVNNKIIFKNKPINFYRLDIFYTAGIDFITEDLKQAILFHTAKIFEDKLGYSPIPKASYNIYKNYKMKRL